MQERGLQHPHQRDLAQRPLTRRRTARGGQADSRAYGHGDTQGGVDRRTTAAMISVSPVTLEGNGVRLEPLTESHHDALVKAASDGTLWDLWFTKIPDPASAAAYI